MEKKIVWNHPKCFLLFFSLKWGTGWWYVASPSPNSPAIRFFQPTHRWPGLNPPNPLPLGKTGSFCHLTTYLEGDRSHSLCSCFHGLFHHPLEEEKQASSHQHKRCVLNTRWLNYSWRSSALHQAKHDRQESCLLPMTTYMTAGMFPWEWRNSFKSPNTEFLFPKSKCGILLPGAESSNGCLQRSVRAGKAHTYTSPEYSPRPQQLQTRFIACSVAFDRYLFQCFVYISECRNHV